MHVRHTRYLYPVSTKINDLLVDVEIKLVDGANSDFIPAYQSAGAAGLDLRANIKKSIELAPGECRLIGTGIAIHIESSHIGAFVFPRSGKAIKEGLVLANGTGVIDSDYQGEIKIAALNRKSNGPVYIQPGERIAQLVFLPIVQAIFTPTEEFSTATDRSENGFGSTGK